VRERRGPYFGAQPATNGDVECNGNAERDADADVDRIHTERRRTERDSAWVARLAIYAG
jgi:hypothetical protein